LEGIKMAASWFSGIICWKRNPQWIVSGLAAGYVFPAKPDLHVCLRSLGGSPASTGSVCSD
jgi:hypothetical protein